MEFKNLGEDMQVRIGDRLSAYWITAKKNEIVELPEEIGKLNKFQEVKPMEFVKPKKVKKLKKKLK